MILKMPPFQAKQCVRQRLYGPIDKETMTAISRTQVPKPANFEDFEKQCAVWWEQKLGDFNLQRYARNGQRQNGVDIHGVRGGDPRNGVGIQCKLKDGHAELTARDVRDECKRALKFRPPLTEFHIVSTSPNDGKLQTLVAELSVEQADAGRNLRFFYWGWKSVTDDLPKYPDALLAFDESYGVFSRQTIQRVDVGIELQEKNAGMFMAEFAELKARLTLNSPVDATVEVASAVEKKLDAEIDSYRDMINGGQVLVALGLLSKLLGREESSASGRLLFRMKANIGACHLKLGDEANAITWLLEAHHHAPSEPKAISNKGLAHLLRGEWEEVLKLGRANLESGLCDESLSSHVIQAARFAGYEGDPLELIPAAHRDSDGALVALALFQRGRGNPEWRQTSRLVAERFPHEPLARQLGAEADIDEVVGRNGLQHWGDLGSDARKKLQDAAAVLSELWEATKASEGKFDDSDLALCGNLILAYRAQGDFGPALATIRYALTIEGIDSEFRRRAAVTAMEAGDPLAEEILPTLDDSPIKNLLIVQLAASKADWNSIRDFDTLDGAAFPESEREICVATVRVANADHLPTAQAAKVLKKVVADMAGDIRASVVVAQYCRTKGFGKLADQAWTNARQGVREDTHISARLMAAMYANREGLWSDIGDLLSGHISTDQDGDEQRLLAFALVQERPIKRRAMDFFEALSTEVRALPRYRYFEGLLNFNHGDLPAAERIFAETMESRPSLNILAMLVMIRRRSNRTAEIPALLEAYDLPELEGTPEEKVTVAHELRRVGRVEEAVDFAYPVLRAHPNDADVAVGFITLMFSIREDREFLLSSTVSAGAWVRLTREGDKDFSFIVEEGPDDATGRRLSPSHPLVLLAMGKKVGDTFVQPQTFGEEITWTVAEITHRYVHVLRDLLENFEAKFPNATGLYSVSMKDGDPTKVLEQVKLLADRGQKAVDLHVKSKLPFQMAAGRFGENPIAFAMGIRELDGEIRTSSGWEHERVEAFELIANHVKRGVVLDAHAAWTAASLDLLDVVEEVLGPIQIPQSSLDDLIVFRGFEESEHFPAFSLVHRGGEFFRRQHDEAEIAARNLFVDQQIEKIKKACTVSAVLAPNTLGRLEDMVLEFCGERILDPIFLCANGPLLLCEDLRYRQFAAQTAKVKGVWMQALLLYARGTGTISNDRYSDAVVNLSLLRHAPVAMDSRVIRSVVARSTGGDLRGLEALARYIGNRSADYVSHGNVVIEFVDASKKDDQIPQLVRHRAMSILFRNLLRHSGVDWPLVVQYLTDRMEEADVDYLDGWMKGHFLRRDIAYAVRKALTLHRFHIAMSQRWLMTEGAFNTPRRSRATPSPPSVQAPRPMASGRLELPKQTGKRRRKRK